MQKRQIILETLAKLEKYFGKKLESGIRGMYLEYLEKLDEKQFKAAAVKILAEFEPTLAKPFPLIKDFLALCGQSAHTKAINVVLTVKKTAETEGQYKSIDFGDRALHSVIERYGGWPEVVLWGEKDWKFQEAKFIAAYEAAVVAGVQGSEYLPGLHEIENRMQGFTPEKLIKKGIDPASCGYLESTILKAVPHYKNKTEIDR